MLPFFFVDLTRDFVTRDASPPDDLVIVIVIVKVMVIVIFYHRFFVKLALFLNYSLRKPKFCIFVEQ